MSAPNFRALTPLLAEPLRGTAGPRYPIGDAVLTGVVANADDTVGMGVIAGTVPADAPEIIGCYSTRYLREAVSLAEKIGMRRFVLAAYGDEVPPATPTACEVCGIPVPEDIREKTKPHTDRVLCIEHFSEWWNAQKEVRS